MKRDFARGVAWTALAGWIEQLAAVAIFLVISRLIGPAELGIAAMAFAFLFLGEFLVRDTLTEAIVERAEIEEGRLEATFVVLVGFALVVAALLALLAWPAAVAYGEPEVAPLLLATSPSVLLIASAGVSTALLRRRMQFRSLALRAILGVLAGGIVGIALALSGWGAWSLVGQRLVQVGVNAVFAILAAGWRPRRWPLRAQLALVRGLGPQVVALRGLTLVIAQTPAVALGLLATPAAVGIFTFAARLAEIVLAVVSTPVRAVAQSSLAEERRRGGDTAEAFLSLVNFAALLAFPACVGLALVAEPAVVLLMGPDWSGAVAVLPFLCLVVGVMAVASLQEAYLLARDSLRPYLRTVGAEAGFGLLLAAVAGGFGAPAVAAAAAVLSLIALPLRSAAALAPEGISMARFAAALAGPAVAATAMGAAVLGWRLALSGSLPGWPLLGGAIATGALTYALMIFAIMPSSGRRLLSFLRP